ncbi:MAG: hypothetical protein RL701_7749, partial [Pseudomonadota bacterium]
AHDESTLSAFTRGHVRQPRVGIVGWSLNPAAACAARVFSGVEYGDARSNASELPVVYVKPEASTSAAKG